ncbi:MAG: hypothetical protein QME66_04750 [Candidatus Eisenbacteria bacterium]|nr:hypothetical protein [Candidatus Eisenbacteria bacterium]
MNPIAEFLRAVAGMGKVITIAYNDGSRPGQPRHVVPIVLHEDSLVIWR